MNTPTLTTPKGAAHPEFNSRRRDVQQTTSWVVEEGQATRGEAWSDLDEHRMRVPFGVDEYARIIRAHELMHVRISPRDKHKALTAFEGIEPRAVECAEEFRVNEMCKRAGFDMNELCDGSEAKSGERFAQNKDWSGAVYFMAALAGTKAAKDYLRGVRKADPEWAKALREVEKALTKCAKRFSDSKMSSTTDVEGLPLGFRRATFEFAKILRTAAEAGQPQESDDGMQDAKVDPDKVKKTLTGGDQGFAQMVLDESLSMTRRVKGNLGRKRVASNVGRNPRRMSRMLTDPQRRVFDRTIHGQGGIVIIDQSGSMSLNDHDLMAILEAAPGCVVIGYSHRPGSVGEPNVWVLAERGKVADEVRRGNGGNGVDGPALRFALSKRKRNEPVLWVCDGVVTDGAKDEAHQALSEECAALVVKHGIHMVENVEDAVEALERVKTGARLSAHAVGWIRNTSAWKNRH